MVSKTKKMPLFYKIFWSVCAALVVVLIVSVFVLRSALANYEKSLPKNEAARVFEELYVNKDSAALASEVQKSASEFNQQTDFEPMILEKLSSGSLSYNSTSSADENEYAYYVKADGKRISKFILEKDEKKSSGGYATYHLGKVEFYFDQNESIEITAPTQYEIFINGISVSREYIVEDHIKTKVSGLLPDGVPEPENVRYRISGLTATPTVTVKETGANVTVDGSSYTVSPAENTELRDAYSDYAIKAAQTYAAYMQSDGSFGAVAKYFEAGTDLYTRTKVVENYFVISHSGYSFENVQASEFYAYDENTFSCRVSFVHLLHRPDLSDYKDYFDVTFLFRKVGNQYLIYDCYTN